MGKFIKLNSDDNVFYINIDAISGFYKYNDDKYTTVCFINKKYITVNETPEEIMKLISGEE